MNQNTTSRPTLLYGICLSTLWLASGCGGGLDTTRVWGNVSYQGQPIEEGQIIFVPLAGTSGPSVGGMITQGHYEIPRHDGPRAGGQYRVEITAFGPEQTYSPNAAGGGITASVRAQLIPASYNLASTLQVEISPNERDNQHDFKLP